MIDRYKAIKKLPNSLSIGGIIPFIPTPTASDYTRGYIDRFFVQQSNDLESVIIEVAPNSVSSISGKPLYTIVSLEWRIVGDVDAVKKSNLSSIRLNSLTMPKISLYLPNLTQFLKT